MSTPRGIFETFAPQSTGVQESPFVAAAPAAAPAAVSPFKAAAAKESPFAAVADMNGQKGSKIPDRRKPTEVPFQVTDPHESFGFEAPPQVPPASAPVQAFAPAPFEAAPSPFAPSPFAAAPAAPAASPFHIEPSAPTPATNPGFAQWQAPATVPTQAPVPAFTPAAAPAFAPVYEAQAEHAVAPAASAPAPAPVAVVAPPASNAVAHSDSFSIRQIELRAIFGVDREMSAEEIMQRSRSLPGIRTIARVSANDIASVEALQGLLNNLGFGGGAIKLYSGSVPIEFIREGNVLLAVQTDGGFAPGVRETLMLVARELSRM